MLAPLNRPSPPREGEDRRPDTTKIYQWASASALQPTFGWTVGALQSALDKHNVGDFSMSGRLWEDMRSHPTVGLALAIRGETWTCCPQRFDPPGRTEAERRRNQRCADFCREFSSEILPVDMLRELQATELGMGGSAFGMDWHEVRDGRDVWWIPRLKPWDPQLLQYVQALDPDSVDGGAWLANTMSHGLLRVDHGRGRWGLVTSRPRRPYLAGLVRTLGESFVGDWYNFRDNMRHQERWGAGIVELKFPDYMREQEIAAAADSINDGSGGGVILSPQNKERGGMEIALHRADGAGYATFDATEKRIKERIAVAIVRQSMSVFGTTGLAENDPRLQSLWRCREEDAERWGDARLTVVRDEQTGRPRPAWAPKHGVLREAIWKWVAYFNFGSFDMAPHVWWDATAPDGAEQRADGEARRGQQRAGAAQSLATAIKGLRDLQVPHDPAHLARQVGIELSDPDAPPPKAPPPPTPVQRDEPADLDVGPIDEPDELPDPLAEVDAALAEAAWPGEDEDEPAPVQEWEELLDALADDDGEDESDDTDDGESVGGEAARELLNYQVRISAAGHPFHPGHGSGVGEHGEIGGKISAAARKVHAATKAKEERRKEAFIAAHGGGHAHPSTGAAQDAARQAKEAKVALDTARRHAADWRKDAASLRKRASESAKGASAAKSELIKARREESAAHRAASKRTATQEHKDAHRAALRKFAEAEEAHRRADQRARMDKEDALSAAERAKHHAQRAKTAHAEHQAAVKAAKDAATASVVHAKKTRAQHEAEASKRFDLDRRETVEEYERKSADLKAQIVNLKEEAKDAKGAALEKIKTKLDGLEFAQSWIGKNLPKMKANLIKDEANAKRFVADSVAGERIRAAALKSGGIAAGKHGVDIHVHPAVHPAALGAAERIAKKSVKDQATRDALAANRTTVFVHPEGTGYTSHAPFAHLKAKSAANGVVYDQHDVDGGVANVPHNGRRYLAVPERGTTEDGYVADHEFAHAVHFAHINQNLAVTPQGRKLDDAARFLYNSLKAGGGKFPSEYAKGNHYEYFAEAAAAWQGHLKGRAWIKKNDPGMADLLKRVFGDRKVGA